MAINAQPQFLKKCLSRVYELVDYTIYWIKYEADFILYPLSKRDTQPEQIGSMMHALKQMDT